MFDSNTVKKQAINIIQIRNTYQKATQSVKSAKALIGTDPDGSFTMSYESMLKASLALMFSYGFRPRVKLGHHKTLISFATHTLGKEFSDITNTYDKMRNKRNKLIYDVNYVSEIEAKEALNVAKIYLKNIADKIIENNPQLKLF